MDVRLWMYIAIYAKGLLETLWTEINNDLKSSQMLAFEERGKPEYLEKNLSVQWREPTN